jgi:hypothetical protein
MSVTVDRRAALPRSGGRLIARRTGGVHLLRATCLLAALAVGTHPAEGSAQESRGLAVGVGVGPSFYCIVTRCDEGTVVRALAEYGLTSTLLLEADAGWHRCFDCSRFLLLDAGVQARRPRGALRPFLSGGVGVVSDAELMGTRLGAYGAVGAWFGAWERVALQLQLRGRLLGSGDHMSELTLAVARSLP